jgi:protein-tyrosine phosphatase
MALKGRMRQGSEFISERDHLRTSLSHPLQIAEVPAPKGGVIGITFCPGKYQPASATGSWSRDLGLDLDAIRSWGARAVVTLVTVEELRALRVEAIGEEVTAREMQWVHLPIEDVSTPTDEWEQQWAEAKIPLHAALDAGGRVLVHCKGGLGRAGLVAARLLIERGELALDAVSDVRRVRPGAIETRAQEAYLLELSNGR